MILVAIDTSTRYAGVAVLAGDGPPIECTWRSERNHGRELMPVVIDLLAAAGQRPAGITHVAVALGPGAFSALRVGISTAIGLALPRSLPVAGITTYEIEAEPFASTANDVPLVAALPAGRKILAWAEFKGGLMLSRTGLTSPEELPGLLAPGALFCGEGAIELAPFVPKGNVLGGGLPARSPSALVRLALERFKDGRAVSGGALQPVYARQPSVTLLKPVG